MYYSSVPMPVSGGHSFAAVCAGDWHSCALEKSGTAWCWGESLQLARMASFLCLRISLSTSPTYLLSIAGRGDEGQLGSGSTQSSVSPVQVAYGHSWRSIACGAFHTCALNTTSQAFCWGKLDLALWKLCNCTVLSRRQLQLLCCSPLL